MFHTPQAYINLKNGKTYHKIGEGIDCTNGHEDTPYVIYQLPGDEKVFIRRKDEFLLKFKPANQ